MMSGYLDNPSATAATFDEEGYLRTGDIAYTREGKVYIIDRAKVSLTASTCLRQTCPPVDPSTESQRTGHSDTRR